MTTRAIEGRINDVALLLAASAMRDSEEGGGGYREDAGELVNLVMRLIRLSHR